MEIPAIGLLGREGHPFFPGEPLRQAAMVAWALEMPLLLTGDPGCGKTDFAFALARLAAGNRRGWRPDHQEDGLLECYVRSETTARDLLYHYDSVRRFGDAHHGSVDEKARAQEVRNYIDLRPLGKALASKRRRVVLVDEIDKAPRDLPNDLLRELDQGQFEIAEIDEEVTPVKGLVRTMGYRRHASAGDVGERPMVVITSNEERQLPNAFLRRCVFCHIPRPTNQDLERIVEGRFGDKTSAQEREKLVGVFAELRDRRGLIKRPSTSELLAWVQAVLEVVPGAKEQVLSFAPANQGWGALPALGCLVKLREDLVTVSEI